MGKVNKARGSMNMKPDAAAMGELNARMNPQTTNMPNPGKEPTMNPLTGIEMKDPASRLQTNTVTDPQGPNSNVAYNPEEPYEQNIFVEQGVSGLTRFGGFVYEEWLKELQGRRGALTYREMRDNDAIIGAFLYAIEMLIRQVNWRVEAAGETPADIEAGQFLETCLDDMSISWNDTISEILSFLPFGWSMMETCYKIRKGPDQDNGIMRSKYNDGRIGWRKWAIRAQETLWRWRFEADGSICGMEQIAPPDYKLRYIPIEKALLFRTKSNKNNPEGRSILRNAYRSWYFKKNIEEIEAIGVERDLAGFPIMWIPPEIFLQETSEAQAAYAKYKKIVTNIKRDEQEGLLMPLIYDDKGNKVYDITMLASGSTRRQFDTNQIITRYDQRIAMTVMADFLMLGNATTGSYALSVNKTSLFQTALSTILQNICDIINTYAIPRLFKLNSFSGLTDYPKLTHDEIEKANLDELGNFIQKVVGSGAITVDGDTDLENYIRNAARFPKRPDWLDTPDIPVDGDDEEGTTQRRRRGKADTHDVESDQPISNKGEKTPPPSSKKTPAEGDIKKCGVPEDDRAVFLQAVQELRDAVKKDAYND